MVRGWVGNCCHGRSCHSGGGGLKQLWDREGKSLCPALLLLPWHDLQELVKQGLARQHYLRRVGVGGWS